MRHLSSRSLLTRAIRTKCSSDTSNELQHAVTVLVARTTLTDLPNELFPFIFDYLNDCDLFQVGSLCRRFNELAMRTYLYRHDVHGTDISSGYITLQVALRQSHSTLSALRLSCFLPPVYNLRCIFQPQSRLLYYSGDLWELKQLAESKFAPSGIETFVIDFGFNPLRVDLVWEAGYPIMRQWVPALREVLCTVIGETHTAAVVVTQGGIFTCKPEDILSWDLHIGRFSRSADRRKTILSALNRFFLANGPWKSKDYIRSGGIGGLPYRANVRLQNGLYGEVETLRSLQTLDISRIATPYPRLRQSAHWFMIVIDLAHITELVLEVPLSTKEWSAILSYIRLPGVSNISVCSERVSIADLHLFLARHPGISRVSTGHLHIPRTTPSFQTTLSLPNLTDLFSRPKYMTHCWSEYTFPFSYSETSLLSDVFHLISRCSNEIVLSLHLDGGLSLYPWLQSRDTTGPEQHLHCVKNLEIRWTKSSHPFPLVLIAQWLSFFPSSLQRLSFQECVPQDMGVVGRRDFVLFLSQSCPGLQVVQLDHDECSVMDWIDFIT